MRRPQWIAGSAGFFSLLGAWYCCMITVVPPHHRTVLWIASVLGVAALVFFAWELVFARTVGRFLVSAIAIFSALFLLWHAASRLAFLLTSGL